MVPPMNRFLKWPLNSGLAILMSHKNFHVSIICAGYVESRVCCSMPAGSLWASRYRMGSYGERQGTENLGEDKFPIPGA